MRSFLVERTHTCLSQTLLYQFPVIINYIYHFTNHAPFNIYFLEQLHYCTYPPYYYTSHSYSVLEELNLRMSRCKTSYVSVSFSSFDISSTWAISDCSCILAFSTNSSSIYFQWHAIKSLVSISNCAFNCVSFFFQSASLICELLLLILPIIFIDLSCSMQTFPIYLLQFFAVMPLAKLLNVPMLYS